jgi:hypothetical protein
MAVAGGHQQVDPLWLHRNATVFTSPLSGVNRASRDNLPPYHRWFVLVPSERESLAEQKSRGKLAKYLDELDGDESRAAERWWVFFALVGERWCASGGDASAMRFPIFVAGSTPSGAKSAGESSWRKMWDLKIKHQHHSLGTRELKKPYGLG